jgi:RNA polymerase sigma factor (sigma-70 family)
MMAAVHNRLATRDLQILFSAGALGGLSDGQLLDRYVSRRDEAVFEAIIRRHGPMVWGVCRRVLGHHHDAEDAFQATFLVLARKASSIVPREMLPNWLYGVACQTAMRARAGIFKRRGRERQVPEMPEPAAEFRESWDDVLPLLDQELRRLPDHYRAPIVLCDLEGKTHRQAAKQLGWPVGTVSGRLSRARSLLAERLSRRGVALSAGALAVLLSQEVASAGMPVSLIASTARAASVFAAGQGAAGAVVSAQAADLTEGVLKTMLLTKLKIATAVLMGLVGLITAGAGSGGPGGRAEASGPAKGERAVKAGPAETRGAAAGQKALSSQEEMKRLEGIWAITAMAEGGEQASSQEAAKYGEGMGRVVIQGDRMTIKTRVKASRRSVTTKFWVDPTRSPGAIAMVYVPEKPDAPDDLPIYLGIYELKGDTLRICAGVDRPDNYESKPGDGRLMMVLKWAFPLASP